ncbi:MAG TPA: hypothetical protein VFT32_04040 [Candidatus Eisenbacteria bacterium]|nr:hypothetical protein [Candidatus Eisenbacteria bacterium]
MAPSLLRFIAALSIMAAATAAQAQYIFLDTNQDGECNAADFPGGATLDTVEVWVDTSKNGDGSPALCASGEALTISSYELILESDASLAIVSWTNDRPEFPIQEHLELGGSLTWVGFTSSGGATHLAPGRHLLGRAGYQRTGTKGCPILLIRSQTPALPAAETKFYSQCLGADLDNFIRLGVDFFDTCSAFVICDGIEQRTWGWIKNHYR